jgi:hypothetical protein
VEWTPLELGRYRIDLTAFTSSALFFTDSQINEFKIILYDCEEKCIQGFGEET